ncbi:HepT-like ribonuclease domain-containing protein [Actinomycetospora sp. OC33-EN08]|uniref:HepT-like ribonuclease domain-containing protein n=1 Tax=Actinomycetospora aurantiaca TaxID=3129233 RepID=A0ABU8MKL8_9PSEU
MVDEARVLALLRSIRADLAFLDREADADEGRRSDEAWLRGIKYAFVTAIEGCVDIAQHLAASESWGAPGTNAEAVRVLGRRGVLDPALADRLGRAVGLSGYRLVTCSRPA